MTENPDLRDLVGDDLDEQERARLERVHQMLVFAGPPPELPPALLEPDAEPTGHHQEGLPRRRVGTLIAIAAAIVVVAFLGGYLYGGHGASGKFVSLGTISMHGTRAVPNASATIDVGERDSSGNWPLKLVVHNLPALPNRSYYEMFLTKAGKPVASCGTFSSGDKTVTVRLNAPYNSRRYDGWVVTRQVGHSNAQPIVLTTFKNENV